MHVRTAMSDQANGCSFDIVNRASVTDLGLVSIERTQAHANMPAHAQNVSSNNNQTSNCLMPQWSSQMKLDISCNLFHVEISFILTSKVFEENLEGLTSKLNQLNYRQYWSG